MKKKIKIITIANTVYGIAACIMLILLCYLAVTENRNVFQERDSEAYKMIEEYQCREVKDAAAPIGMKNEYRFTLKDILRGDTCLAFYVVHQYVEVYLDGELLYSLMPSEKNRIGKTVGSNWIIVPIYPEDEGKEVCVVTTPVYEGFEKRKVDFFIGSQLQIYLERLKLDLPQLIVGILSLVVGMAFIGISVYNLFVKKHGINLAALGCFSVMLGLWRLTDTRFTPLMFKERPVFVFYVSLAMLMLGMIPLVKSMGRRFHRFSYRVLNLCCLVNAFVCLVQLVLQIMGVADFRETLFVTHIVILISVIVIIASTIYEKFLQKEKEQKGIGRHLPLVCVAGVAADVIAFYIKGNSSGLIFTLSAFLLYIIFAGIVILVDYREQEKRLRDQEAELASNRISIMLSQIQPHFLYNSLNTIYHLCEKDSKQARKAISDFSDYLRGNLDSLKRTTPIPFETELKHVKVYLSLEKMRFDEELNIVYDIETTCFLLPALTVQPLVENAVKHGVGQTAKGGTVKISTRDYKNHVEITVWDDGAGYEPSQQKQDGKSHVGIENVRNRLWKMSHATLEITSEKGTGTKAVIKLPKEEMSE